MATVTTTFPRPQRAPRHRPVAGRESFPEIHFLKRIDNSRLRREVDPEKRRECFGLLGLFVPIFFIVMLFAWTHFQCVRYGYRIEQLKQEVATLEESNHGLKLKQAALADPQRIDALARQELGLSLPGPKQVTPTTGERAVAPSRPEFARNFSAHSGDGFREQ